ncbi:hypothetical protein ASE26_13780 [Duganella sp. Root198D2]|nr:hypothetical protein ASD07_12495 [Duganella sp. Root336D2]KRB81974.1 hypothetical protein ASE26_13780 [Duganella sp. Root198D2]
MYEANRAHKSCIYLDDMIYSPKVPVFRDDDYGLLDEPFVASMLTAPAVNRGAVARNEPQRLGELEAAMLARIDAFEHVTFSVLDRKGAAAAAFEAQFTGEEFK